jgi:hypothetical protein
VVEQAFLGKKINLPTKNFVFLSASPYLCVEPLPLENKKLFHHKIPKQHDKNR